MTLIRYFCTINIILQLKSAQKGTNAQVNLNNVLVRMFNSCCGCALQHWPRWWTPSTFHLVARAWFTQISITMIEPNIHTETDEGADTHICTLTSISTEHSFQNLAVQTHAHSCLDSLCSQTACPSCLDYSCLWHSEVHSLHFESGSLSLTVRLYRLMATH